MRLRRTTFRLPKPWKRTLTTWTTAIKRGGYLVMPHLIAVTVLILYLLLGSLVFCVIEGWDNESQPLKYITNISAIDTEVRNDTVDFLIDNDTNGTMDIISRVKRSTEYLTVTDMSPKSRKKTSNRMIGWNMFDGVLFAYSTVTTIGYNDLTPITNAGRAFYILYAMFGVPLCTVVLLDWALFVEEFSHYLSRVTGLGRRLFRYDTRRYSSLGAEMIILFPLAAIFFLLYVFLGALLLGLWECGWTFTDGFYAAFDAVTTIGIGDIRPSNHDYYPLTLVYVTVGIAVASTCLTLVVSDLARLIHYAGRRVTDCASKTVYFGSRRVRVSQLLAVVAGEWGVEQSKVQQLLGDRLDSLVNQAVQTRPRKKTDVGTCNNVIESSL